MTSMKNEGKLENTNVNKIPLINILSFYILAWINGGVARYLPFVNAYVILILFVIWFVLAQFKRNFLTQVVNQTKWLIIFILSCLLTSIFIHGGIEPNLMGSCFILIIYSIYIYYKNHSDARIIKFILLFLIIDKCLFALNTIRVTTIYPEISRLLAAGYTKIKDLNIDSRLLAGYAFIYSAVALVIYVIGNYRDIKKEYRLIISIYILLTIALLIKASYTIALICMVSFVLLGIVLKKGRILFLLLIVLIFVVFYKNIFGIIYKTSNYSIWSNVLSVKMKEFADFMLGRSFKGSDIAFRFDLYYKSIRVFFANPFFGVYEKSNMIAILGDHSEWYDVFAMFGIFRGMSLILFYSQSVKDVYNHSVGKRQFILVISYIILVGFVNPIITRELALDVFIVIPFLNICLDEYSDQSRQGIRSNEDTPIQRHQDR